MSTESSNMIDTEDLFLSAVQNVSHDNGATLFRLLRKKWSTVPAGLTERLQTSDVLKFSDEDLYALWQSVLHESTAASGYTTRGWYHDLYKDVFAGKRVLEIGSGMGIDGIYFASCGANWHFCDIIPENMQLIKRIMDWRNISYDGFSLIERLDDIDQINGHFDFIYCQGSMINTPEHFSALQTRKLLKKLKPEGRWIELCYPKERWEREGALPFDQWGEVTDGKGTPWVEWYDLEKIQKRLRPGSFDALLAMNFHGGDFNWFDLKLKSLPFELLDNYDDSNIVNKSDLLAEWKRHGTAQIIAKNDGIDIATDDDQWHYALQIPLAEIDGVETSTYREIHVKASLRVTSGVIGIGVVAGDLTRFICQEEVLSADEKPYQITLKITEPFDSAHLIIRQVAPKNALSCAQLFSVQTNIQQYSGMRVHEGFPLDPPVINLSRLLESYASMLPAEMADQSFPVIVPVKTHTELQYLLGIDEISDIDSSLSVRNWTMENGDAHILKRLYQTILPRRHLEFGTWKGFGAKLCAQNCGAEIWTINLPDGEYDADGEAVYRSDDKQTDAGEEIGILYKTAGLDDRIHQILADSKTWTGTDFKDGFFDTALIDGGHDPDTVMIDTFNALRLVRDGGLVMWHDFCPCPQAIQHFSSARGVALAIHNHWHDLRQHFDHLFWAAPSFLLIGIKKSY